MRTLEWSKRYVFTSEGRPYDHAAYPHIGAPGGPFDAFDCPQYLAIWLQWASRLGKSFTGQCVLMKTADMQPCPMMFASSDQKLAVEVTDRTYRMLAFCEPLRGQLRPEHRRRQDLIDLASCRVFVGWSRSTSTLADKAVRVGHANEIDKWEHKGAASGAAKEADPLKLFSDRFKEFPSHKKIYESTPAQKSSSRIERGRLASTNCLYWVPCPKCGRYQTLKMAQLKWDKTEAGKSDKDLARRTARYLCEHCEAELRDEHRGAMMRGGVWIPEGCGCDDEKAKLAVDAYRGDQAPRFSGFGSCDWLVGTLARDGRDYGSQISSLYALSLSWGDVAAEWVDSQRNGQNLRNFINQWLAETWQNAKNETTWEQLGAKLTKGPARFTVPEWASLITIGVDAQEEATRLPWIVTAWGPGRTHAVIGYGESEGLNRLESELLGRTYGDFRCSAMLIDSGNRPLGIYEFCREMSAKGYFVLPCKGSSTALESEYVVSTQGPNTSMPGMKLIRVDTIRSQCWLDRVLHSLQPGDEGSGIIHAGSLAEHQDFLEQVLNDAAVTEPDKSNNDRERWERIDAHVPNDFRDAWRYAYIAMLIATRGAPILPPQKQAPKRSAVISSGATRPDGRPW